MKKFIYKAKDKHSELISGEIEAATQQAAAKILISKNLFPIEIEEEKEEKIYLKKLPFLSFLDHISVKKKAIAIRQLATLINAGLPLTQCLETMAQEATNKKLKDVFSDVLHKVEGGTSLAQSFAEHPEVFSGLDISLITAGEKSGTLDKVLKRMATQLEKEAQLISKVRGAMVYPSFILVVVIGVISLMLMYVVPRLSELYKDFKGNLPFITQIMIKLSNFLTSFWWLIILILITFFSGFKTFINTSKGRRLWDSFKIEIPAIKNLLIKIYLARFTRTLGTLIGSGVPVLDALKITSESVGNILYKEEILNMVGKIRGGSSLALCVSESSLFPSVCGQMIKIGEQTGEMDNMLDSLANYYEEEVDNTIRSLSTLLEPVIIVFMGLVVGGILVAIMSPIYGISQLMFKR